MGEPLSGPMRMTRATFWALAVLAFASAASGALAGETSGLPLPRFVSLRSDEVNVRTGPGVRYPIDWIYARKDLPVEVIAEFEAWRKIRDWQGTEGWVHQSMLSGRRMMVVIGTPRSLRSSDAESSDPVAIVEPGVTGRILQCPRNRDFCRIEVGGQVQGWLRRDELWGVYKGEWIE
jgi:SH3-like domain-containing protein